jgi:MinD-like ATPase involved in chromosome partitioning or flagellar assembly
VRSPLSAQIPSSRAVPISINRGVPITLETPGHPVSQAIFRFAQERLAGAPDDNRRQGIRSRSKRRVA